MSDSVFTVRVPSFVRDEARKTAEKYHLTEADVFRICFSLAHPVLKEILDEVGSTVMHRKTEVIEAIMEIRRSLPEENQKKVQSDLTTLVESGKAAALSEASKVLSKERKHRERSGI